MNRPSQLSARPRRSGIATFLLSYATIILGRQTTLLLWNIVASGDHSNAIAPLIALSNRSSPRENEMGKYVLAWLLGVPAFVLVIVYIFAH